MQTPLVRAFGSLLLALLDCRSSEPPSDSTTASPAGTTNDEVVATVLGRSITRHDLESSSIEELVLGPLFERYRDEHGIVATKAEIDGYLECIRKVAQSPAWRQMKAETADEGDDESEGSDASSREFAETVVIDWKMSKRLYEEFGGAVIFQQANPLEPIGAYRAFLESQERAGAFRIVDSREAESFWCYFRREPRFVIPPEKVDYSTPWWTQD